MYRDEILDLYKHPRNEGTLETEIHAEGENPSCGDQVEIYVELDEEGDIEEVTHQTDGCAISTAAVSIVADEVVGMTPGEVLELDRGWIIEQMGIDISPMRVKCAVIGLKTLQKALEER